jgi:Ca-activated chloride channel family protein
MNQPEIFRFAHPEVLWALILLPIGFLILFFISRNNAKKLAQFGDMELVKRLTPEASKTRRWIKWTLQLTAIAFSILAMAGPQFGSKLKEVKRKGVEVMIALDISKSMLAEDIQPNRLDNAKRAITLMVNRMQDDLVGMVVFAGNAYMQVPITVDYGSLKMALASIDTDAAPTQGTNIAAAIEMAAKSFSSENGLNKVLIVISDGEDHDQNAIDMAGKAAEAGIVIHTIGMGSLQGAPIPIYTAGGQKDFKKNEGSVVITHLNEVELNQIAQAGGGTYVRANNSANALSLIYDKINDMEKKEYDAQVFSDYIDRYQAVAFLAFLALVADMFFLPRKNKYLKNFDLFEKRIVD